MVNKTSRGRPSSIDDNVLAKLVEGFSYGFTDVEASLYAGISYSTLYRYIEDNPDFGKQKEVLKNTPKIKAKLNIKDKIESGDVDTSKRYLERKAKDEFSTRQEVDQTNKNIEVELDDQEKDRVKDIIKQNL